MMTWTRPLDAARVDDLVTQIARSPQAVQYLATVEAVAHELASSFQRVARLSLKLAAGASAAVNFAATTTSSPGSWN